MTDKVVDASAIVALLFNELTRDSVVARLRGASLFAPSLIAFEVANACLKKIRTAPFEREALLDAFSLFSDLSVAVEPVDLRKAISLADATKLTLYDASYLWLALTRDVELVTLDAKLAQANAALRGSNAGR